MRIKLLDGGYYGVTDTMGGKMEGMWSLNTSPTMNSFCLKMREIDCFICSHCYSKISEARWKACREAWQHNFTILTTRTLKDAELPIIKKVDLFRFQAHGDLGNRIHYKNLIRIAEANPKVRFALWTKNLPVINKGGVIRLKNLVHVYSTPLLNNPKPIFPKGLEKVFDKVFTVYNAKYRKDHKIKINCGAKSCFSCQLCYTKNDIRFVNEELK